MDYLDSHDSQSNLTMLLAFLSNYELKNADDLSVFCSERGLSFVPLSELTFSQNLHLFREWLKTTCPIHLSTVEGNHRMLAVHHAFGNICCTDRVPMQMRLHDSINFPAGTPVMHAVHGFKVAYTTKDISESTDTLLEFSQDINMAQQVSVKDDWASVFLSCIQRAKQSPEFKKAFGARKIDWFRILVASRSKQRDLPQSQLMIEMLKKGLEVMKNSPELASLVQSNRLMPQTNEKFENFFQTYVQKGRGWQQLHDPQKFITPDLDSYLSFICSVFLSIRSTNAFVDFLSGPQPVSVQQQLLQPKHSSRQMFLYHGIIRPSNYHVPLHAALAMQLIKYHNAYFRNMDQHEKRIRKIFGIAADEEIDHVSVLSHLSSYLCFGLVNKVDIRNFNMYEKSAHCIHPQTLPSPGDDVKATSFAYKEQAIKLGKKLTDLLDSETDKFQWRNLQAFKLHYCFRESFIHDVVSTVNIYGLDPQLDASVISKEQIKEMKK